MDRFSELKAFCLVAGSGGFSSAARQLGVATSSVTRLVDALEQRIGAPLLNRSTRSVTLTDSGSAYYQRATAILEELEAADDAASARDGEVHGQLRVSAPVTFSTMYIAPLIGELARRHPRLELDLRLSDTVNNMVDESIDVAIRIGTVERQPNLIARRLMGHERVICASAAYLEQRGRPQAPAELAAHNCVRFAYGGARATWRLMRDGQLEEIGVHGTLTANNSEVLRQALLDGVGIGLLPRWLVRDDLASGALLPLLEDYQANPGAMDIGLYAVYQENRRGAAKVKAFVDLLADSLAAQAGARDTAT